MPPIYIKFAGGDVFGKQARPEVFAEFLLIGLVFPLSHAGVRLMDDCWLFF